MRRKEIVFVSCLLKRCVGISSYNVGNANEILSINDFFKQCDAVIKLKYLAAYEQ
jgi:hypothetical protein